VLRGLRHRLIEAFAHGVPVLASRLGSMAEIVEDGVTGLLFEPGDPRDLAAKATWLARHPEECRRMGLAARKAFEKVHARLELRPLMRIYEKYWMRTGRGVASVPSQPTRLRLALPPRPGMRMNHVESDQRRSSSPTGRRRRREPLRLRRQRPYDDGGLRRPAFRDVVSSADLVVADGVPMVWGLRALGLPQRRRVRVSPTCSTSSSTCRERGIGSDLRRLAGTLRVFTDWLARECPRLKVACAIDRRSGRSRRRTALRR
jgi:hypothetical protein